MNLKLRTLLVIGATLTASCASQGARPASATNQRNLLTAEEMAVVGDANLHEALTRLRPTFLRPRTGGGTTGVMASEVTVYYDGMKMPEGIEHLREIPVKHILEVQFLEPQQANARFGGSNNGGALVIISKK